MPTEERQWRGDNIIFISGPSGVGKQEVIKTLLATFGDFAHFSVSVTTREPRKNEASGLDYDFVTEEKFLSLIEEGAFVEYAQVHGNWYGTPLQPILDALNDDKLVIGDMDVQGSVLMREKFPLAYYCYLYVEEDELRRRLTSRGDDPSTILTRVENSRQENDAAFNIFAPKDRFPSLTVFDDDGNPTMRGITNTAGAILEHLRQYALYRWGLSPACHKLILGKYKVLPAAA